MNPPSLIAAALLVPFSCAGLAADFSGRVTANGGAPIAGAMVTVFNAEKTRKQTVYTTQDGSYAIRTPFAGTLTVRARASRYADGVSSIEATGGTGPQALSFALAPLASAEQLSDDLVATAHAATLPWQDDETRHVFVSQCHFCHQIGNAMTRQPREEGAWRASVRRMQSYFPLLTNPEEDRIVATLHKGFDGKPVKAVQTYDMNARLPDAKVEEWHVGDALSFVHDADIAHDGKLYGVDEGKDVIWILDPESGKIDRFDLPEAPGMDQGGRFAGFNLPAMGVFTGKHGPHSMAQTADGRIWITNSLSSTLMSFDPRTRATRLYDLGFSALYPHTIRVDRDGILWFTLAASNQVARFDPATGTHQLLRLPANGFWRWAADTFFPLMLKVMAFFPKQDLHLVISPHKWARQGHEILNFPYGLDINPRDGSVWYAKLYANKIGRIDAKTLAITEYDTPLRGPRRLRFGPDGILWIPSFDDGALMRFDSGTARFETLTLPRLAPNEYEVPYALNVHPATGDVWITSNQSDRLFRYDPRAKSFSSYPLPARVVFMRDIVFTKDGRVCSANANLPAHGSEDRVDAFVCLDLEGGRRDRQSVVSTAVNAQRSASK